MLPTAEPLEATVPRGVYLLTVAPPKRFPGRDANRRRGTGYRVDARLKPYVKWGGLFSLACLAGACMVASAAYLYLAPLLPSAETYRDVQLETPLRIYTSDLRLIDEIGNRRDPVDFEDLPQVLIDALIATEDVRFYSHPGVDIQSLLRGFYGFVTGNRLGGGSTITMQLANNLSFESDNVYFRKFKEILFALQIQRELTREEILTLYLNTIYFGSGADGIGAAASVYYGKEVNELTLAESAMMISLLPCPSACNPLADPERALGRRETRLANMLREDMISDQEFAIASAMPVTADRRSRDIEAPAPYVAEMVRQELFESYGEDAYTQGFEVITSIDGDRQMMANAALINGLENYYDRRHGYRGPAASYPPDPLEPERQWLRELEGVPTYGNQRPAIVTSVQSRTFTALMQSGEIVTVPWEGIRWAYRFRNRNEAWPPPQAAGDVVAVGDLVRVRESNGEWQLGQVPDIQGALVSVSPDDGSILALVGGYDFRLSQVNRVTTPRPPGSNFKPFLYAAALANGYSPSSTINDAPFTRGDYRPSNYENNFLGPITLRHALRESRNVPAVRLYDQLGSATVLPYIGRFGFPTPNFPANDLTVALGSQDTAPLEIVAGYASIANGGFEVNPWLVRQISNIADGIVYRAASSPACEDCATEIGSSFPQAEPSRVIDERVAFILGSMLRSVIEDGSGARVQREIGRSDLMGKTGTTNGPQELWFSGFNRNMATTVFIGFDQPEPLGEREQGATVAVPIWIDYMKQALEGEEEVTLGRPDGIVDRLVDRDSGAPAMPGDPNAVFEYFLAENAPEIGAEQTIRSETSADEQQPLSTETIF